MLNILSSYPTFGEYVPSRAERHRILVDVEEPLSSARQFLRVQKSYIVNIDFAKTADGPYIKMNGEYRRYTYRTSPAATEALDYFLRFV